MRTRLLLTPGVKELNIPADTMETLYTIAINLYNTSSFISFIPQWDSIQVEDGNGNILHVLEDRELPEQIWIIADDYEDYLVFTALLPSEY